MAYSEIEPFGDLRADLRMGVAAARLAGLIAGGQYRPADFMPDIDGDLTGSDAGTMAPGKSTEEMRARIEAAIRFATKKGKKT